MSSHAHRLAVRQKLMVYIQNTFINKLNDEFIRLDEKCNYSFEVIDHKWSVLTNTNITYSAQGTIQHDDDESIQHIELWIILKINNKLAGEFGVKFSSEKGFYNLEDCITKAKAVLDLNNIPKHKHNNDLLINDIKIETNEPANDDPRLPDVVTGLTSMNVSKRRAIVAAEKALFLHPDLHDIDSLVDEAMQTMLSS